MERILRDTQAEVRVTVTNKLGEAANATGAVKVTITRDSDGSVIVNDQNASSVSGVAGGYAYTLAPANIPEADLLTAVWKATIESQADQLFTTEIEVVGGQLCSLEAITAALGSGTSADNAKLREARAYAERVLEDACGVAFRPRYAREVRDGDGSTSLMLYRRRPLQLISVSVGGTALTSSELADVELSSSGLLYRAGAWASGFENLDFAYIHGYRSPPEPVSRAAVKLARSFIVKSPSNFDERATSVTTDEAHYSLVTPGVRGAHTSIPEVNRVIEEYGQPLGIA
jgi:hypothetical protein